MQTLMYKGIAGGGDYDIDWNDVNTRCLPHNPDPAQSDFPTHFLNNNRASSSFIHGSEYQYTYRIVAVDDDVPCAVCDVAHVSSVIMIPAKMICPAGWSIEYARVLTAATGLRNYGLATKEYLCVDENA